MTYGVSETTRVKKAVYAQRSTTEDNYDAAIKQFLTDNGVDFVVETGDVAGIDYSDIDLLIIGAPGTGFTAHTSANSLDGLPVNIISMCRHTTRNALSGGSASGSFNMDVANQVAEHDLMTNAPVTADFPSTTSQGCSASGAGWYSLYDSNDSRYPAIHINDSGEYFRAHWAYYRFDLMSGESLDLAQALFVGLSVRIAGNAVTVDGTAVDSVAVFDWTSKALLAHVEDIAASGDWETTIYSGEGFGITYFAAGFSPETHGPYVAEAD